jgi:hypothetical protein
LEYDGNECAGEPANACQSVHSGSVTVADQGPDFVTLECPRDSYLAGWDTQQDEFLRVVVVSPQPDERPLVKSLTVAVLNDAIVNGQEAVGNLELYIGCSRKPWHGTPFASERTGLPSNGILESATQQGSNGDDQ